MTSSYASALLQSIVALAGVCALAVLLLRLAAGKGLGRVPRGRMLELVERMPLDARSAVAVVRAGDKAFLVGTSDGAPPTLLAEIPVDSIPPLESMPKPSFRALLGRDPPE